MKLDSKEVFKTLNPNKVWIPVALGILIVGYLFYSDPDMTPDKLKLIFEANAWAILLAILVLLARDSGYVYRIRTITDKNLSWTSSIYVIILWEFASAVTPSVVGGTAVAIFILHKEGINLGKALAYVMLTAILDNLFFVVASPIVLAFAPDLFPSGSKMGYFFFTSYGLIATYTFIMCYALFIRPRAFKWFLLKVTSLRLLRRWRYAAYERGNEIIWASSQLRGKAVDYWFKIIAATIFIWTSRYLMLNVLISGYRDLDLTEHLVTFSQQIILWVVMLVAPTPGSSGMAEYAFREFFTPMLGGYVLVVLVPWRLLTFYFYLLLGAIFLPRWVRRVFRKKPAIDAPSTLNPEH